MTFWLNCLKIISVIYILFDKYFIDFAVYRKYIIYSEQIMYKINLHRGKNGKNESTG